MSHPDPEALVGLALGDDASSDLDTHVEQCSECRCEIERTRVVLAVVPQLVRDPVQLERPPESVWADIQGSLSNDAVPPAIGSSGPRAGGWPRSFAASALGLAAGVAATLAIVVASEDSVPAPSSEAGAATTLAQGRLEPFSTDSATAGTATVVSRDGQRYLQVRLSDLPSERDAYVQAWLLDPVTDQMIALGLMNGGSSSFDVPDGVDFAKFSAVDVSLEPLDGDPAHSETSLARGSLQG